MKAGDCGRQGPRLTASVRDPRFSRLGHALGNHAGRTGVLIDGIEIAHCDYGFWRPSLIAMPIGEWSSSAPSCLMGTCRENGPRSGITLGP